MPPPAARGSRKVQKGRKNNPPLRAKVPLPAAFDGKAETDMGWISHSGVILPIPEHSQNRLNSVESWDRVTINQENK